MSQISVKCVDQVLIVEDAPDIASGDVLTDSVKFTLCPLWDGYTNVAVFYNDPEKMYNVMLDENNTAIIPSEVMKDQTILYIGVMGLKDDMIRTSNLIRYRIYKGAIAGSEWIENPTPSIFEQLLRLYNETSEKLELIQTLSPMEIDEICNLTYVEVLDDSNLSPIMEIDEIPVEDVANICV